MNHAGRSLAAVAVIAFAMHVVGVFWVLLALAIVAAVLMSGANEALKVGTTVALARSEDVTE